MTVFEERLRALPLTYASACRLPIGKLVDELRTASALQVLAVGSGGSLITARLLARLAERQHRSLARAMTPLTFAVDPELARGKHLWLVSAEGKNPDILAALEIAVAAEPARLVVLCNRGDTPLVTAAAAMGAVCLIYPMSDQRDGFLATHSLLLSSVLLVRAAAHLAGAPDPTLVPIEVDGVSMAQWIESSAERLNPVLGKETLIILYDPTLSEMAELIETNIWEAALGNVQLTDLRNFAHGRHHWLSQRSDSTGLLALTTPTTRGIWDGIEAILPASVARASIELDTNRSSAPIAGLWAGLEITNLAGLRAGIDPGSPKVADFGRSIYYSTGLASLGRTADKLIPALRKQSAVRAMGLPAPTFDEVREHERQFREQLRVQRWRGLVLDYDGTIVATSRRGAPPGPEIIARLSRLLGAGIIIGVATGRGGSVGEELRQALPRNHLGSILIGYYNGGVCLPLDEKLDKSAVKADEGLQALAERLAKSSPTAEWIAAIKDQRIQLSLVPVRGISLTVLRFAVVEALDHLDLVGYQVLTSSHTVDVLTRGVSKLTVLYGLRKRLDDPSATLLCVGDSGAWPGNDFDLLSTPLALSVDRVSSRLETGWNLLPAGRTGPSGLAFYLDHTKVTFGEFVMDLGREI